MVLPSQVPDPISADKSSPYHSHWAASVEVFMDGHQIKYAIEASARFGYVIVLMRDESGKLAVDPDDPDKMMTYRREGKVELRWRNTVGT